MAEPKLLSTPAPLAPLAERFAEVRSRTVALCKPLRTEDHVIQSMPDVSPPKWHLAHTSWFFETFVLREHLEGFEPFDPRFHFLFNSYYKGEGAHFDRARRGLLSRPGVEEVLEYREWVDDRVRELLAEAAPGQREAIRRILTLGLHHEQQHQELLLTDIKHILWTNPLRPAYRAPRPQPAPEAEPSRILSFPEGLARIGLPADAREFAFDNEMPRHRVFLEAYGLHSRPVSCGEYLEFIEAGGYRDHRHWLSEGWDRVRSQGWEAPLYWERDGSGWQVFTLEGMKPVDESEPVCHVSYFEADAFARWRGARLPTEAEWESAAEGWLDSSGGEMPPDARFDLPHPRAGGPLFLGNVWEWTSSAYSPYPGFRPAPGAVGEYNGKFMCNQYVLRGGSVATPPAHVRPSYRNFFQPEARWQFTGLRIAL